MASACRAVAQGVGVVAVLHDLNLALRYADDVLVLGGGGLAWGALPQTLAPALVQQVWGMRCDLVHGRDGVAQYLFTG